MSQNKEIGIIIYYEDFLKISDETKQKMLTNPQVEWFISIKNEKYEQLSEEEKQNLDGFRLTEQEPLRVKKPDMKMIFEKMEVPETISIQQIGKEIKERQRKRSKPYVPKIIGNVCTKKKGGR